MIQDYIVLFNYYVYFNISSAYPLSQLRKLEKKNNSCFLIFSCELYNHVVKTTPYVLDCYIYKIQRIDIFFKVLFIFRERGREGERETSMCGCLLHAPNGDLTCNPGMCPDWESNLQPFASQAHTQSTEL